MAEGMMKTGKVFYLVPEWNKRNTAGYKAPADIAEICRREGFQELPMPYFRSDSRTIWKKLQVRAVISACWFRYAFKIPVGSTIIYQHPYLGMPVSWTFLRLLKKRKQCCTIAVIHDLESLRGGIQGAIREKRTLNKFGDQKFLKEFDAVICHNEHMRQYLIEQGFEPKRLICLELFDYLLPAECQPLTRSSNPTIAIAGSLNPGKCAYIYKIFDGDRNAGLTVNLYGNEFDCSKANEKLNWKGSFTPDELPAHLTGDFGLVWDGTEASTCAGNTGAYLRYNNPHKTSLYLASGMPVIVWSQAAIADFVLAHGVGTTVESLYDLKNAIQNIPDEAYKTMCANAMALSGKLRSGWFIRQALLEAFSCIQTETEENT